MTINLRAVVLAVENPARELLVHRELLAKPHIGKYAGNWSIPMETIHPKESDAHALCRLHEEELGGLPSIRLPARFIGAYRVVPGAWAKLYATIAANDDVPTSCDPDVADHRWMSVEDALKLWLRQGAREMIEDFAAGRRNVLRKTCSEVRVPVWV